MEAFATEDKKLRICWLLAVMKVMQHLVQVTSLYGEHDVRGVLAKSGDLLGLRRTGSGLGGGGVTLWLLGPSTRSIDSRTLR